MTKLLPSRVASSSTVASSLHLLLPRFLPWCINHQPNHVYDNIIPWKHHFLLVELSFFPCGGGMQKATTMVRLWWSTWFWWRFFCHPDYSCRCFSHLICLEFVLAQSSWRDSCSSFLWTRSFSLLWSLEEEEWTSSNSTNGCCNNCGFWRRLHPCSRLEKPIQSSTSTC